MSIETSDIEYSCVLQALPPKTLLGTYRMIRGKCWEATSLNWLRKKSSHHRNSTYTHLTCCPYGTEAYTYRGNIVVKVLQRNRSKKWTDRLIDFKDWLTRLWRLADPKSAEQANRLETQARVMLPLKPKGSPEAEFPLHRGPQSLKSFNWLEEAHPHYGG